MFWYSMYIPLIYYILICKTGSSSNLPESLLITHKKLQASVSPLYHTKSQNKKKKILKICNIKDTKLS